MATPGAGFVMNLLKDRLFVGTTVQTVLVEEGISPDTAAFPASVLTCPRTQQDMVTFSDYQDTYDIHALLLDRWDSSTLTLEAISGNLRTQLELARANVNAAPGMPDTNGVDQVFSAPLHMEIALSGPVEDEHLGFPVVAATLLIRVKSLYFPIGVS